MDIKELSRQLEHCHQVESKIQNRAKTAVLAYTIPMLLSYPFLRNNIFWLGVAIAILLITCFAALLFEAIRTRHALLNHAPHCPHCHDPFKHVVWTDGGPACPVCGECLLTEEAKSNQTSELTS